MNREVLVQILQPARPGGVLVILTGDYERARMPLPRGEIVVTGRGAAEHAKLLPPYRHPLVVDEAPQNTREQALAVVAWAREQEVFHLTLVVSGYHAYRAWLTFLRAILDSGMGGEILLDCHIHPWQWYGRPFDQTETRLQLLAGEADKVRRYHLHVATEEEALAYLRQWWPC